MSNPTTADPSTEQPRRVEPNPEGLAAARALAGWELGDRSWADSFINAYLHPAEAREALRRAQADD